MNHINHVQQWIGRNLKMALPAMLFPLLMAGCTPGNHSAQAGASQPPPPVLYSLPDGILTFSRVAQGGIISLFDYNLSTKDLIDYGEGEQVYRAKSGAAAAAVPNPREGLTPRFSIVIVSPDGKDRRKVVENIDSPMFLLSQDGKTLVYEKANYVTVSKDGVNHLYRQSAIILHNVETGEEGRATFTNLDQDFEPHDTMPYYIPTDWMPDGKLLLTLLRPKLVKTPEGKQVPVHFLTASQDFKNTTTFWVDQPGTKPVEEIFNPRVAPDGKRIAFSWDGHIWVADIDGSNPKQVTTSEERESYPAWSPDGKWLAVELGIHDERGIHDDRSIWLVPVDGAIHRLHITDHSTVALLDKQGNHVMCRGRITWWPSK